MGKPILMKGNEALAEAALIAGCRHYFAYPITPQNEVSAYMALRLPELGGVFLQAESEVASINMVMGAAAAGARAMTSSSSPGISLMQEGISYLAGAELPAVVVNIMRGGPGLGNIAGAQGDYFQAVKGGGHGDYRNIVLAPASVQELADLTVLAFDLADKYRMVAMVLGDGLPGADERVAAAAFPLGTGLRQDRAGPSPGPGTASTASCIPCACRRRTRWRRSTCVCRPSTGRWRPRRCASRPTRREDAEVLLVSFGLASRVCRAAIQTLRAGGAARRAVPARSPCGPSPTGARRRRLRRRAACWWWR